VKAGAKKGTDLEGVEDAGWGEVILEPWTRRVDWREEEGTGERRSVRSGVSAFYFWGFFQGRP
jgi:hypothetical protein